MVKPGLPGLPDLPGLPGLQATTGDPKTGDYGVWCMVYGVWCMVYVGTGATGATKACGAYERF